VLRDKEEGLTALFFIWLTEPINYATIKVSFLPYKGARFGVTYVAQRALWKGQRWRANYIALFVVKERKERDNMPKGENPNSKANLKVFKTSEQAREAGRNGAKKSAEVRRQRKTLREELLALLSDGDTQGKLSLALIEQAKNGNTKAFEIIRDTIGEKPVERIEQSNVEIKVEFEGE